MKTRQQENRDAYNKMLELNNTYSQFPIENRNLNSWWKQLNALKPELCDSLYWDELVDSMDSVKSKIIY